MTIDSEDRILDPLDRGLERRGRRTDPVDITTSESPSRVLVPPEQVGSYYADEEQPLTEHPKPGDTFTFGTAGVRVRPDQRIPQGPGVSVPEPNHMRRYADLSEWWRSLAEDEIRRTVPKAVEYGATDLVDIGRDLAKTAGREVTDEEAAELGIYFYLRGKLARWTDAIVRGERPSDDTLFDIGVYVRMAQRCRTAGGWPGEEQ